MIKRKLIVLFSLLFLVVFESSSLANEGFPKYPPYPDVWGLELPVSENVHYAGMKVVKMPDGDYLITYAKDRVKGKDGPVHAGKLLFSGGVKDFKTIEEYNSFFNTMRNEKRIVKAYPLALVVFRDGSSMKKISDMHPKGGNPFDWYLERKDKNGKVLLQKKVLYLYDKPVKKKTPLAERNFDYKEKYYTEKVSWPSEMIYLPLEDDTFLVVGFLKHQNPPSIIILRFDKDFKTKSDLAGKKIFLFDHEIYSKMKRPLDDQTANDFFYNFLIKIRKEK
jgi:hypothetical protein